MHINQHTNSHTQRIIGHNLAHQGHDVLQKYINHKRILYVSDAQCYAAYACFFPTVDDRFYLYESSPIASKEHAEALTHLIEDAEFIIAIGSGTINDLCKYAAFQRGIPYAIIATAPSMNGYSSSTASLLHHGHKHSFACAAPILCIADIGLLAYAPMRLRAAGVGDTLCRSVIMPDLALAHHLCGSALYDDYFATLIQNETHLIASMQEEGGVGLQSTAQLITMLLDAGDAMRTAQSSAPASQGEHMIAHLLEHRSPEVTSQLYHGELIAITTLAYAPLQQQRIMTAHSLFRPTPFPDAPMQRLGDTALCAAWNDAYEEKLSMLLPEAQRPPLPLCPVLSQSQLHHALTLAGCPTAWEDAGGDTRHLRDATGYARFTRSRWTYLDVGQSHD